MMEERSIRYEVLRGEEEHVPAHPVVLAMVVPPPSYEEPEENSQLHGCNVNEQAGYFGTKLPSYTDAVNLPSYEEAERLKEEEAKHLHCDVESQVDEGHEKFTGMTIGTDFTFLCTFILSFVFNWVGFLLSLCISNTVAGYCGALSGLGISIVKWVAIVKHNQWADGFADGDSWIWWLLILCGFLIFIRGAIQYIRVKYDWHRFTGQLRRYYFF